MTKNDFKKKYPDVKRQELTLIKVLSRSEVEKIVVKLVDGLRTALLGYTYSGKKIIVFTSDSFKNKIERMNAGTQVLDENTGHRGSITSDKPFLCGTEMCVRVQFADSSDVYSCDYLFI